MTNPTTCPGCGRQTESSLPACQFCNFRWAVWNRAAPPASAPASLLADDEQLLAVADRFTRAPGPVSVATAHKVIDLMQALKDSLKNAPPRPAPVPIAEFLAGLGAPSAGRASAPDALTLEEVTAWEDELERGNTSRYARLLAFARERLTAEVAP